MTIADSTYLTLPRASLFSAEIEIKKSRFICVLTRVEQEAQAREFIQEQRKVHHAARHHCSAFVIGPRHEIARSNDDGEPQGTAGMPMLEVLASFESVVGLPSHKLLNETRQLSDVCAVVIRYFGGTLLGAGGLVRAYSEAVSNGLGECRFVLREKLRTASVAVSHAQAGRVENALRAQSITVERVDYQPEQAQVWVAVPMGQNSEESLMRIVSELTAGSAVPQYAQEKWVDSPPF